MRLYHFVWLVVFFALAFVGDVLLSQHDKIQAQEALVVALQKELVSVRDAQESDKSYEWLSEGVLKVGDQTISRAQLLDLLLVKSLEKK